MPTGRHSRRLRSRLANQRQGLLANHANCDTPDTRGDGEPDHPRLPFAPCIRNRAENGDREYHQKGRCRIRECVHEIRRSEICHDPRGEVERGDVHREDRVREVVQRPAPSLDAWRTHDGPNLAVGEHGWRDVLWMRHVDSLGARGVWKDLS